MKLRSKPEEKVWAAFQEQEQLSDSQVAQFKLYRDLLEEGNKITNLTAITELSGVVHQHFEDSLALRKFIDLNTVSCIADVGCGAGFPVLPLKIMFPHLAILLMEVNKKKQQFLEGVITALGLADVQVCGEDWRTFLRTSEGNVPYFVSRAALDVVELCRIFRTTSAYRNSTMVYWASAEWQPDTKIKEFITRVEAYKCNRKDRQLIFMQDSTLKSE